MEAPNKIYIPQHNIEAGTIQELCELTVEGSVEYIRKDLLMQWLESKVYEHNEDKFDDGFNTAIGQVIDKINSL